MSYKDQIDVAQQLISKVSIPTLPDYIIKLQALYQETDIPNHHKVKQLIVKNPLVAGELVALANSQILRHSPSTQIKDIDAAIYRLGHKHLKNYVLGIMVKQLLNTSQVAGLSYHSEVIANIAFEIAHYNEYIRPDEAYLLGLLHDLGAFILADLDDNYGATFVGKQINHYAVDEDEVAKFGTSHSALGYAIINNWKLPSYIAQTILLHHSPNINQIQNSKLRNLTALIELAHAFSIKTNHSKHETESNKKIFRVCQNVLGLTDDAMKQIQSNIKN